MYLFREVRHLRQRERLGFLGVPVVRNLPSTHVAGVFLQQPRHRLQQRRLRNTERPWSTRTGKQETQRRLYF